MKLQAGVYPEFYGDYPQIIEEETSPFVGREDWLKLYWDRLSHLVNKKDQRRNKALLAHRKTGKTSFLRKLYNLAFTQQEEVIPFYYEFSNQKKHGKTICKDILKHLICQATDFLLKGDYYFSEGERFEECLQKLQELKSSTRWAKDILQRYEAYLQSEQIYPEEYCDQLLSHVWKFVHKINGKPCMLIVDEAQEMAKSIFAIDREGKEKIIPSHYSLASIHNAASVWIILSGSRVSELYYKMVGALANRIERQDFYLLEKEDACDLMKTLIKHYNYSVYPEIYEDVWDITDGHPFYIQMIFHPNTENYFKVNKKEKSFTNFGELQEILYFEVANRRGNLYRFWENHFIENVGCLDDGEDERGTTLHILFHVASNEEKNVSYKELEERFQIKNVHAKIQQLMDADLIQIEGRSQVVDRLSDKLLSMFLAVRYSAELFGTRSEDEIRKQLDKLLADIVGEKLSTITTTVDGLVAKFTSFASRLKSIEGKINYLHGTEKENEIRERTEEALKAKRGIFKEAAFVELLRSVNVYSKNKKKGQQFDACGAITINGKKLGLAVEVKSWSKTANIGEAKSFLDAIAILQDKESWSEVMCVYIIESGLSKPAQKLFKEHNVIFGTAEELLPNLITKDDGSKSRKTITKKGSKASKNKVKTTTKTTKVKSTTTKQTATKAKAKTVNTRKKVKAKSAG